MDYKSINIYKRKRCKLSRILNAFQPYTKGYSVVY